MLAEQIRLLESVRWGLPVEAVRIEVTQPRKNQRRVSVVHAYGRIDVVRVTEKVAMEALYERVKLLASLQAVNGAGIPRRP